MKNKINNLSFLIASYQFASYGMNFLIKHDLINDIIASKLENITNEIIFCT